MEMKGGKSICEKFIYDFINLCKIRIKSKTTTKNIVNRSTVSRTSQMHSCGIYI